MIKALYMQEDYLFIIITWYSFKGDIGGRCTDCRPGFKGDKGERGFDGIPGAMGMNRFK